MDGAKMNDSKLNSLIITIAESCPKLRELEHWQIDENRGSCKQIIISRDKKGAVQWKVQAPPAWYVLFYCRALLDLIYVSYCSFGFESIVDEFD